MATNKTKTPDLSWKNQPSYQAPTRPQVQTKSGKWVDTDPDVQFAQHAILESHLSDSKIADKSGCATTTVANIRKGATRRPQNATINAIVCKALGYERVWLMDGVRVNQKGYTKK